MNFFVFLVGSIPTFGELGSQHGQHGQLVRGRQLHDGEPVQKGRLNFILNYRYSSKKFIEM